MSNFKIGKPRLDKHERLLHRFYEPLMLLSILSPSTAVKTSLVTDTRSDFINKAWRRFLDQLCWVCDYKKAGESVCAIAAEDVPEGPKFWLCVDRGAVGKAQAHLEALLHMLEGASTVSDENVEVFEKSVTKFCIEFAGQRIRLYKRILGKAVDGLGQNLQKDTVLYKAVHALLNIKHDHMQLCSIAHNLRHGEAMQTLSERVQKTTESNWWSSLNHVIGRLASWPKAARVLVSVARRFPQKLQSFSVEAVNLPRPVKSPEPDSKTHIESALKRMFRDTEAQELATACRIVNEWPADNIPVLFRERYTEETFMPRVHAEVQLLEHFYHHSLKFLGNDRYIGCSKGSCYCCHLYFRDHPGSFCERPTHGNIWTNWQPPVPPKLDSEGAKKHTADILNEMIKKIRRDVKFQILSRQTGHRFPDSTTGISEDSIMQPDTLHKGILC